MKTIDTLDNKPFKHLITTIGALPTSFIDSMSYYEMLAWLCDYLEKTVIPAVNENAEVLEELQAAFVELQSYVDNYFENLDIQTEINAKLDDMAESGQLETIIAEYLNTNAILAFDTLDDMKASESLVNGAFVKTYGYYEVNDGGAATYKVRTVTNEDVEDDKFIVALADNTLVAELVTYGKEVNILSIGGGGEHLAPVCNYVIPKGYRIYIPRTASAYTLTETITVGTNSSQIICDGDINLANDVTLAFNVLSYRNILKFSGAIYGYTEDDAYVPDLMHIAGDNRSSNYNQIYIHRAHQFVNGFVLMPNGGGFGCAYNEFSFDHITANVGILLTTGSTGANFVTENTFNGGRLECNQGIVFTKGANQTDRFNGNRFYNIDIESANVLYGINIDFCTGNYFNQMRLTEGLSVDGKWIKCGTKSYENHFSAEYQMKVGQIQDEIDDAHYRNYYDIVLMNNGGSVIAGKFETTLGKIIVPYVDCIYIEQSYLDGNNKTDSTWNNDPDFYTDGMIVKVGSTTANTTINYNLPAIFGRMGIKEIVIFVAARKANTAINIYESNGSTSIALDSQMDAGTEISGYGKLYLARYTGRANYTAQHNWQLIPLK